MTKWYENKVGKIIDEEFDARLDGAILSEILRIGWETCAAITDEEIDSVEGNGIMTKEFCQSMMRAERRICKECNMFKDFFPYIRKYMGINGCQAHDITLYQEDYQSDQWNEILYKLDLDGEEMDAVDVIAIVD